MANLNREIRIAIMGATGSGKSTRINKASRSDLESVDDGLESCASKMRTTRSFVIGESVVRIYYHLIRNAQSMGNAQCTPELTTLHIFHSEQMKDKY
ncbi:uncharacterized protein EDB91DRAFT_1255406 [Suillus paluster]|uniref:uncharacterized protein n=1 Tax=Suillus paluster TaxID=48578 RepID=UPI001B87CBBA|nr:uncharacterized protein EDB91DRAFT_1255406 [Suillus paluster]KAG1724100.1 hypothetical protein EDB91DRAFT_1255406 [Suillus paluster]